MYVTMQYCIYVFQRGTIHNELEILALKGDRIREARVLHLFKGICDGLIALHKHKPVSLAHRYCIVTSRCSFITHSMIVIFTAIAHSMFHGAPTLQSCGSV